MDFHKYFSSGKRYLEIGPLDNPFLRKDKYNVRYLDYNDTETVKTLYANSYAKLDSIVDIDYATHGRSYKETIGDGIFDGVYSSHVIEHTTDLIAHFQDVADILEEGGSYYIVYPDKTHYADYFRQNTTFREVYDVYRKPNTVIACEVAESVNNVAYQYDTSDFHNGEISFLQNIFLDEEREKLVNRIYESDDPVRLSPMCHKWVFDEKSMLEIIRDCIRYKLIPFCVEETFCTSNETNFDAFVILKKKTDILFKHDVRIKELLRIERKIEKIQNLNSPLTTILDNLSFKDFYIYGTGAYGVKVYNWLKSEHANLKGFLCSDNQLVKKDILPAEMLDNVHMISEFIQPPKSFIIVAVRTMNSRSQIENEMKTRKLKKFKDYVCV